MRTKSVLLVAAIKLQTWQGASFNVAPNPRIRLQKLYVNVPFENDAKDQPRKNRQKRKRRFSQDAHPFHEEQHETAAKLWQQKKEPQKNDAWSTNRPRPKRGKNSDSWRSNKSIEELEASLTKRYGTRADKWTADPNEYEFVHDDDHDVSENQSSIKSSIFRGRPVLDPWQKQELKEQREKGQRNGAWTQRDAMLNRVRRNQERLQRKSSKQSSTHDVDIDFLGDVEEMELEDEDEEWEDGYDDDVVNDFVENDKLEYMSDEKVSIKATPSPGFFFRDTSADEPKVTTEKTKAPEDTKPSRKARIQKAKSILGEDGNPLYLTLDQAQKNFEAFLEVDGEEGVVEDTDATPDGPITWEELGITSDELLANLETMQCPAPLSVQEKACPPILENKDVLVGTYTGSGKTLAFLVPLAQRLLDSDAPNQVQVLIVAPGRELASQIVSVARLLLEGTNLSVMLAIGGTTFGRNLAQIRKRKPSILVGTPGRIAELVVGRPGEQRGRLKINALQYLVLDEFDALLEYKPHRDPTNAIIQTLKQRHGDSLQSILCSATASDMISSPKLNNFLQPSYALAMADRNDRLITSGDKNADINKMTRVSRTVLHGAIHVAHKGLAIETIRKILHTEPFPQQVLIFADNSHRVEILVDKLANIGIIAAPLHGGRSSQKMDRAEVSKALREGYVGIVVATELAARGLDAPLLTHVINLDLPTDASHYAHRAGRCGRGGRPGVVINVTTQPKERNVPKRFAESLGITMHTVEPRSGKLCIVDPETQSID